MEIYITSLSAYNQGRLMESGYHLPMDEEELQNEIQEVLTRSQEVCEDADIHEEIFITDYECDFMDINEYNNIAKLNETVASERQIPLFETATEFFLNQIQYATSKKSEYLFCKEDGTSLNDSADIRGNRTYGKIRKTDGGRVISTTKGSWYELLDNLGLEYRKMKNTRHTFAATALSSNMMSMQEVATILGHTSLRMIVNVYAKYLGKSHIGLDRGINIFNNISTTKSTTSYAS